MESTLLRRGKVRRRGLPAQSDEEKRIKRIDALPEGQHSGRDDGKAPVRPDCSPQPSRRGNLFLYHVIVAQRFNTYLELFELAMW